MLGGGLKKKYIYRKEKKYLQEEHVSIYHLPTQERETKCLRKRKVVERKMLH